MKCDIPEISWHNREPVLSVDFQRIDGELKRVATAGVDRHVLIWFLKLSSEGVVELEFAADLIRHDHAVNVVRFSPSGEVLASGDDDGHIIVWKRVDKSPVSAPNIFKEADCEDKENWTSLCTLRGHIKDVYDLCWSSDGNHLISGSVDNSAILWDVSKGKNIGILSDHRGFVQGVAWDPLDQFVATLCSDRCCRVYNIKTRRVVQKIYKTNLSDKPDGSRQTRLFYDDTLKSFCRRLTFSPDGELLIIPTGIVETDNENHINVTYVFSRHNLSKPVLYFPSKENYTTVVRCCPVLFHLRSNKKNDEEEISEAKPWEIDTTMFKLPYRIVFAVASQNAVTFYDTQQRSPFAYVSNMHFTGLTDMSWSDDGRILIVASTDGYCSFITFEENEIGIPYKDDVSKYLPKPEVVSTSPLTGSQSSVSDSKEISQLTKCSPVILPLSAQPPTPINKKRINLITLFSPKLKSSIQVTCKNTTQSESQLQNDGNTQQNDTKEKSLITADKEDDDSIEIIFNSSEQSSTTNVVNAQKSCQKIDGSNAGPVNVFENESAVLPPPEPMEIDAVDIKEELISEKTEKCNDEQTAGEVLEMKMETAITTNMTNISLAEDVLLNDVNGCLISSEVETLNTKSPTEVVSSSDAIATNVNATESDIVEKKEQLPSDISAAKTQEVLQVSADEIKETRKDLVDVTIEKDDLVSAMDSNNVELTGDAAATMSPVKVHQPQVSYTSPCATKPPRRVQLITLSTPPKTK